MYACVKMIYVLYIYIYDVCVIICMAYISVCVCGGAGPYLLTCFGLYLFGCKKTGLR